MGSQLLIKIVDKEKEMVDSSILDLGIKHSTFQYDQQISLTT